MRRRSAPLAVTEYLNLRHAANALGVAQSSVSARVKALEGDLGILLFERHARGVRLTETGRHFVQRIAAAPAPSILRFDVERSTLSSLVGQGFGITVVGAATALLPTPGIVFLPFADEPEPITFSAVWSR